MPEHRILDHGAVASSRARDGGVTYLLLKWVAQKAFRGSRVLTRPS